MRAADARLTPSDNASDGACPEHLQDMLHSLGDRQPWHLVRGIPACSIPLQCLVVHDDGVVKRVIAFRVVGEDRLPRRQDERGGMKAVRREQSIQFGGRDGGCFVKQAKRIDNAAIEEDPFRCPRVQKIFLDVPAQDLLRER
jgi:hypothetical protein